ncbi:MAG: L-threonine 3-dehydrogenase [Clostridia bacterium]|nr:L-threonine 3-dehydrogenase [Clostridia bacterium]
MKAILKARPGKGNIEIGNTEIPVISDDDVLIKIKKAGICGTDFHIYSWDRWSEERIKPPLIIGHEFAGVIETAGRNVSHLKAGQRVSAEGHIVCNKCKSCLDGNFHICDNVRIIGVDRDGCFAEYLMMPASNVWPLKDEIADKYGSIMDPLGNAMHTVSVSPVSGRNVFISGAGSIGLFAIAIARYMGADKIMVSEPNEFKRKIAMKIGADIAINPFEAGTGSRVIEYFNGHGPDVVLEMSGAPSAILLSFNIIAKGGDMALLGLPPADITLDISNRIIFKGLTVKGVSGRRMYETWEQCDRFLLTHSSSIDPVITHEISMEDINRGFLMMERNEAIKVLLNV